MFADVVLDYGHHFLHHGRASPCRWKGPLYLDFAEDDDEDELGPRVHILYPSAGWRRRTVHFKHIVASIL